MIETIQVEQATIKSPVLNDTAASAYIGVSRTWLRNNRRSPQAPPFLKIGGRVLYRREDLDGFIAQRVVRNG